MIDARVHCCTNLCFTSLSSHCSAAISTLPLEVRITPDFGYAEQPKGLRGYVDVYVNGCYNIGVELTRDGSKLAVHEERFGGVGLYAPLTLKSLIVADFRKVVPHASTLASYPNTLFVVFSADFRTATIMQQGHADEHVELLTGPQ